MRIYRPNLAPTTEEGINDAVEAIAANQGRARMLADVLEENPRKAIRRALRPNRYQRAYLHQEDKAQKF